MVNYRLGVNLGTNSIGWCTLSINKDGKPITMLDWNSRIFHDGRDPKTGESCAVQRTTARSMSRRYDRLIKRRKQTIKYLTLHGLMPGDVVEQKKLQELDPLKLRSDALERELTLHEVGRALFHLQQKRGFKSNRKDAQKAGNDMTSMKEATRDLASKLDSLEMTLGQFLHKRTLSGESTNFRPTMEKGKMIYDYYPTRAMVEEEFNRIWSKQETYHVEMLAEGVRESIHRAIFSQRKLKSPDKGRCTLVPSDERISKDLPSAQLFRIIKEVNNLAWTAPFEKRGLKLTQSEREKIYSALNNHNGKTPLSFTKMRKLLEVGSEHQFNLESAARSGLDGDRTARLMREEKRFGEKWDKFSISQQNNIVNLLLDDSKEDEVLLEKFMTMYGLSFDHAENIINTPFAGGCLKFGKTVIDAILPEMQQGMLEHEAIAACGWHHSYSFTGEVFDELPYYGKILEQHVVPKPKSSDPMARKYGAVTNVTVHIALNQLRRLMNKLKERYGCWPQEIVIEMARDLKKSPSELAATIKEIEWDTKQKEKWRLDIEQYKGSPATENDFKKMKLWHELAKDPTERKCVFTGKTIGMNMIFGKNNEVNIVHILPYSKTLDNSSANLILVTRQGAFLKGNLSPYEAFKDSNYEQVLERSQSLKKSKKWRFLPEAMDNFSAIEDDFLPRQLNDTSHIAKMAAKYLAYACEKGDAGIIVTRGIFTGMLRKTWGLNALLNTDGKNDRKNTEDHRHHAVDAFVISLTTRTMVKNIQKAALNGEETGSSIMDNIPDPWPKFSYKHLQRRIEKMNVSHKSDHGREGKLHEDTCYGYAGEADKEGNVVLVIHKPINSFSKISDIESIRDNTLRMALLDFIKDRIDIQQAIKDFCNQTKIKTWRNIRHVRVLIEKSHQVMISPKTQLSSHKKSTPSKLMQGGSNHHAEIYCIIHPDKGERWGCEIIKTFDVNQKEFTPQWKKDYPNANLITVLHRNDIVAYEENGKTEIRRVKKLGAPGNIFLTPCNISKQLEDEFTWGASARQLQLKNARKIHIDVHGDIYDPLGFLTTKRIIEEMAA